MRVVKIGAEFLPAARNPGSPDTMILEVGAIFIENDLGFLTNSEGGF